MTLRFLLAPVLCSLALTTPVQAQSQRDILAAEFLPGWKTENGTLMGGLRLQLAQGWKTYWRSPGDAGIPPEFDWSGSSNLGNVRIHWPTPDVFMFNGMRTIGYAHEVVLPVEIWPERVGEPVELQADVALGVCRDICVPTSVHLNATLVAGAPAVPAIARALKSLPETAREAGVRRHGCSLEPGPRGMRLEARIQMPSLGPDELVVVETADPRIWVSEAEVTRKGSELAAVVDLVSPSRKPFALDRSGLTLTVLSAGRAVEISGCPAP